MTTTKALVTVRTMAEKALEQSQMRQESVTIETLKLLQETVDYLHRPAGILMAEVIVASESVTYRFPEIKTMHSLENLRTGEMLKF